ncbi:protein sneaky-like [Battus philenor]|uniref:protein sneaky-like n=1 Tax=Battus philenor TaxID=42288 RepID=UPI0035D0E952
MKLANDCGNGVAVRLKTPLFFLGGFALGQLYYIYFLKDIELPCNIVKTVSLFISIILGIGNASSVQMRCISLLTLPMYCGKPGRGVLKAVVLTYVIAGPITNMGYNAKEVVRVFACSTQLSYNLSEIRYKLMAKPIKRAIIESKSQIDVFKNTIRSIEEVIAPIENEIEGTEELIQIEQRSVADQFIKKKRRTKEFQSKYLVTSISEADVYQKQYLKKIEYRCEDQISRGIIKCVEMFESAYSDCCLACPQCAEAACSLLKVEFACEIRRFINESELCNGREQIHPGLGEGYSNLKRFKKKLTDNLNDVKLQYKVTYERELYNIQDAKETGKRVMHEFEQRGTSMQYALSVVNICLALMMLRILVAAQTYHDRYLTSITYDNVYITTYFKRIDERRKLRNKYTLLPLKKMERNNYVDVHSFEYKASQRSQLVTLILKVMLEVVTATTFVMLDRLFYEALDVVRQHAKVEVIHQGTRDLEIEVDGNGTVATMMRNILNGLNATRLPLSVSNELCLPRPRSMPSIYFIKIYCGYLWILLLLYLNPFTTRLNRLICSYFYPRREKQRILYLYNDILKKRMKMQKTLRRKALQAVRAHYLSGQTLCSLRMRFPRLFGWLSVLPAARMTCLICGETEPRPSSNWWYRCSGAACGFAWCGECWREAGARCLACDPLTRLSDLDSLSDDQFADE